LLEAGTDHLRAAGFGPVQYLAFVDAETLVPLDRADRPGRLLVAAYLGKTRLIDNIPVASQGA
jgi:pantoate--beta-alanine ligase